MRAPCWLAIAHLLVAAPMAAQWVQGEVVSAGSKRQLPGVRVVLYDSTDSVAGDTRSDSVAANFFFDVAHPGQYRLAVFDRLGNPYMTPAFAVDSGATVERQLILPALPAIYDSLPVAAKHVDVQAESRTRFPRYPDGERAAGHTGTVRVAYVIDAEGNVEPGSLHVISATNDAFATTVLKALPGIRFATAAAAPRPARVVDQETYTFSIAGAADALPCVGVCITALGIERVRR